MPVPRGLKFTIDLTPGEADLVFPYRGPPGVRAWNRDYPIYLCGGCSAPVRDRRGHLMGCGRAQQLALAVALEGHKRKTRRWYPAERKKPLKLR